MQTSQGAHPAELPRVRLDTRMPTAPARGHTVIKVGPPAPARVPHPHAAAYVTVTLVACTCAVGCQRLWRRALRASRERRR
jgi:hypothetical protein